jgi:antibiotic biosynthesis monooxygenase (ABM) superfamily enzyme
MTGEKSIRSTAPALLEHEVDVHSSPPQGARPAASAATPPMPSRWKMAVVVWLAIYPCLTFLLWLAGPRIASWALPLRTLALTALLVPLMVFLLLPAVQRLLAPWLRPRRPSNAER